MFEIYVHIMVACIMQNYQKTPMLYKEYSEAGIGNNRIFGSVVMS